MTKARNANEGNTAATEAPETELELKPTEGTGAASSEETEEVAKKETMWGSFKVEVGVVPERAAGNSKYDWAAFPKPSNPDDPKTWTSVTIPNIGGKTIYKSIRTFREKEQAEGRTPPEFTVSVIKDKDGNPSGVRVIRKS